MKMLIAMRIYCSNIFSFLKVPLKDSNNEKQSPLTYCIKENDYKNERNDCHNYCMDDLLAHLFHLFVIQKILIVNELTFNEWEAEL